MREHGILKRVLLAYDEIILRIRAKQDFPLQAVTDTATIILTLRSQSVHAAMNFVAFWSLGSRIC